MIQEQMTAKRRTSSITIAMWALLRRTFGHEVCFNKISLLTSALRHGQRRKEYYLRMWPGTDEQGYFWPLHNGDFGVSEAWWSVPQHAGAPPANRIVAPTSLIVGFHRGCAVRPAYVLMAFLLCL